MKKEILRGLNILKKNPYTKFETILREKRLKKEKKLLQLKIAILSGSIRKVK
jgi:hypothetical protein